MIWKHIHLYFLDYFILHKGNKELLLNYNELGNVF